MHEYLGQRVGIFVIDKSLWTYHFSRSRNLPPPPDYFHCHFQTSHHLGVIHKVRSLGGGRGGPAKTVLARMRGGERSSVSVRTP